MALVVIVLCPAASRADSDLSVALQAYDMRMLGCAEDARALLEARVLDRPTDAAAWYELGRTHFHMGLGRPAKLDACIRDATKCMENAVLHDPTNLAYRCCLARLRYFDFFQALQHDSELARQKARDFCRASQAILQLAPEHYSAALHLVEVYALIPAESGGDRPRAEEVAASLSHEHDIWGARALALLLLESDDVLDHWTELSLDHEYDPDVIEELGRCYLRRDDPELATRCFDRVLELDARRADLLLDLARYHFLRALHDRDQAASSLRRARGELERYLETDPPIPLRAYAFALQANVALLSGNADHAMDLRAEAEGLDAYYSRALATPPAELFVAPGQLAPHHRYLLQPF
jgi:tetratricopeptide (TPR) repeat protein